MRAEPDSYVEPISSKRHLADRYWEQRSRLLLPHRMRLNTARIAAVTLPEPVVGSIWAPCRPHDATTVEALCLYLNSSVGLLALLGGRDSRIPSYPSFSIDTLRSLPVPDFDALGADARDAMTSAFDSLKDETLQPLPQMNEDPVRKRIDDAVASALALDPEWVAKHPPFALGRAVGDQPALWGIAPYVRFVTSARCAGEPRLPTLSLDGTARPWHRGGAGPDLQRRHGTQWH